MAYLIFTSFLIILAEFELTIVLQWFAIMISAFGRGCVYICLGLTILGIAGLFGFISGLLMILNGLFHFILACLPHTEIKKTEESYS
jgi:hypothetical protein